jgi:diadenosine tetraphosphate (Ap4A) HIT family hydrolase
MSFALDERLAADASIVGDMTLTRVLLMNDARWPWLILAPRRDGVVELTDLDAADRTQLIEEAASAAGFLKAHTGAHKINIGTLGNIVRQLHLHVVARTVGDPGWPGPVWGFGAAVPRDKVETRTLVEAARAGLGID